MSSAIGRLMIATQSAILNLDGHESERDDFAHSVADHVEEKLRQSFLTWKANRVDAARKAAKEAEEE